MSEVARRSGGPFAEIVDWLESEVPSGLKRLGSASFVPVEDFMDDNTYVLRAQLPGIDPEKDVEITLANDILTIKGERREEQREKTRREFQYGSFVRSFSVPQGVEGKDVTATYVDGVLEVRVPIAEETKPEPQKIAVNRTS